MENRTCQAARLCSKLGTTAAIIALSAWASASARAAIPVADIGEAVTGHNWVAGYGINNSGQVAATSSFTYGYQHAMVSAGGVITDVGGFGGTGAFAHDINNNGEVCGYAWKPIGGGVARARAFIWDQANGIRDIGIGAPESISHIAYGINDYGRLVGTSSNQAFYWQNGGSYQYLTKAGWARGCANDINNSGRIVGWNGGSDKACRPTLWLSATNSVDLGTLNDVAWGEALDINDDSMVVGCSYSQYNLDKRATMWDYDNGTKTDLGTLTGGYSIARGVNNNGEIVGESDGHAFYWNGTNMIDLNDLINPNSGWELTAAHAINDHGQITGTAMFEGQTRGFILAVPEPAMGLPILAALLLTRRCNRRHRE